MWVLNAPRQAGKTQACINLLQQEKDAVLVAFSHREADRLRKEYPDCQDRIVAAADVRRRDWRPSFLVVDNVELLLAELLGNEPKLITMTALYDDPTRLGVLCAVCDRPFTPEEWDNRHSDSDGEDIHAACCGVCAE